MRHFVSDTITVRGRFARKRLLVSAMASVIGVGGLNVAASNASLTTPAGLAPGTRFRYIYVTTQTTAATSTNESVYDAIAVNDAAALGNSTYNGSVVTWEALVSTDAVEAGFKLESGPSDPLYTLAGAKVASGSAGLFNTASVPLLNPIGSSAANVWTGTNIDGTTALLKGMGDSSTFSGELINTEFGIANGVNGTWIHANYTSPDTTPYPIYAFSSELTVPASVPEPRSSLLFCSAGSLISLRRRQSHPTH